MPEEDKKPDVPPSEELPPPHLIPATGFPPENMPTAFADGVANIAPSLTTVKFYLYRTDPDISGAPRYRNAIVAQVVMPIDGFVASVAFLNRSVSRLVEQGALNKEQVDAIYSQYS
jgi:hypothetical protein